jgi:transposase
MNLLELQQYTIDEERAEEYLRKQGIIRSYDRSPHCESTRIGRVRRSKFKCYDCRREWGPRRGSTLEGMQVPLARVLHAIKLFELDTSVRESVDQLALSNNTVYDLFNLFRQTTVFLIRIHHSSSLERLRWMNPTLAGGEKETWPGSCREDPGIRYPGARRKSKGGSSTECHRRNIA